MTVNVRIVDLPGGLGGGQGSPPYTDSDEVKYQYDIDKSGALLIWAKRQGHADEVEMAYGPTSWHHAWGDRLTAT